MNRPFYKHIGSGRGSRIEWDVIVENGRVWFEQENDGYMFMRPWARDEPSRASSRQRFTLGPRTTPLSRSCDRGETPARSDGD